MRTTLKKRHFLKRNLNQNLKSLWRIFIFSNHGRVRDRDETLQVWRGKGGTRGASGVFYGRVALPARSARSVNSVGAIVARVTRGANIFETKRSGSWTIWMSIATSTAKMEDISTKKEPPKCQNSIFSKSPQMFSMCGMGLGMPPRVSKNVFRHLRAFGTDSENFQKKTKSTMRNCFSYIRMFSA